MKSFFKYVLATMTGLILTFLVLSLIAIVAISALITSASSDSASTVADNSLLHISLNHEITERTVPNPFEELDIPGFANQSLGLDDIVARITAAKSDDRIEGILLDLSGVGAGFASLEEIRQALNSFKESGKFIYAYGENYTQKAYYIASVADRVFLYPEGAIDFRGLSTQIPFFKGTLEKLGVDMQVVKVGTYKSAVEPFIQDEMSAANREQVNSYLSSIYEKLLADISASRSIPRDSLHRIADEFLANDAASALSVGLVDELVYKDQLLSRLKDSLSVDQKKDINAITLIKYKPKLETKAGLRDRVAVVYANGDIESGEGDENTIGSEKIARELRKLRNNDRVKAVVLRVNSPGGSALASDVMWREVELMKEAKPIFVSMGDVAASGGYYIAAAADSIFAQANTLTGSIGVFGTIPNLQKFWNDKIGVTFDGVKTGKFADFMGGGLDRPMTAEEANIMQLQVNQVYATFLKRVADGRNLSVEAVDSIGQGRVWTGSQAVELGLVDRIASLDEVIVAAANAASLTDYQVVKYPGIKGPFDKLLSTSKEKVQNWFLKNELGVDYRYVKRLKDIVRQSGIQARLAEEIIIN